MPKWLLYLYVCTFTNFLLIAVAFFGKPFVAGEIWKCYLALGAAIMGGILCLAAFIEGKINVNWTLTGLAVETVFLIAMCAVFYFDIGLHMQSTAEKTSLADAVYFSIVTWTTVGYGDISPTPVLRLVAATEAALGYIFSGALVGLLVNKFKGEPNTPVA